MTKLLLPLVLLFASLTCFGFTPSPEKIKEWRQDAEQGDAEAQNNLGFMYDSGNGVPRDDAEAVKWYRKAAEQGNADAQYNLGVMYANGEGVPEDDTEAVRWYRKAAEQGTAVAQYYLGMMYDYGEGVPADYVESYMWFNLAAAQGFEEAKQRRKDVSLKMPKEQIAEAQKLSREWLGVPEDDAEAVKWYRKAAEQGDAVAQYNLGMMYANGEGVPQDDAEAVKWYRKAAEQGYAQAQTNLGMMYYFGHGVPEDYVEYYMWLNLAAAQGFEEAKQRRKDVSSGMTKEQIAEAQKLSREWLAKRQK